MLFLAQRNTTPKFILCLFYHTAVSNYTAFSILLYYNIFNLIELNCSIELRYK